MIQRTYTLFPPNLRFWDTHGSFGERLPDQDIFRRYMAHADVHGYFICLVDSAPGGIHGVRAPSLPLGAVDKVSANLPQCWYLGIDLDERVPDYSTISQLRRRKPAFDPDCGIITAVTVTPGDVHDPKPYLEQLEYVHKNVVPICHGFEPQKNDSSYGMTPRGVFFLASITASYEKYSLCQQLHYYHTFCAPEQTQLQKEDAELKPVISRIFEKSGRRFGVRRIRAKLLELGYTISERRTSRLIKELGLSAKGARPRLNSANDRQYQYYPNKLKRQFLTDAPNMVWGSDITYAKIEMDFIYLCVIIDLYSQKGANSQLHL